VADIAGAVLVGFETSGGAASAGMVPGDVVTAIGGAPIASVAELRAAIAKQTGDSVSLGVTGASGATKTVSVPIRLVADTIPLTNGGLLYNRALFQLQDLLRQTRSPLEIASATLNLAIVEMKLGNWDEALKRLNDLKLPDGPGVSGGTVTYLTALCLEAL